MPTLKKIPGQLTVGEALERLKQNPDDPELQEFKASLERFSEIFVPTAKELNRIAESYSLALKPAFQNAIFVSQAINFDFPMLHVVNEIAESQKRIIEAFRVPNYLFESLKIVSEQINQMYEPIRLLGQSFAIYQTPRLFNELTKLNTNWVVPGYVVTEDTEIISPKEYEEDLVEEEKVLTTELAVLEENKFKIENLPYYYYRTSKTLIFQVTTLAAIPLYTKDNTTDIELLVTTFLDFLEEKGEIIGEFKKVFVPIQELVGRLVAMGKKDVDMNWIKSTKSNFVNHKIPELLKDVIKISDFDRTKNGYYFQIRVRIPIPKKLS